MKTKLASAIALIGLVQSSAIMALGLGNIEVSSAVNERLDASIPLVNTRGLDDSQILVTLASKADFARAGVDRDYFLTNVAFNVENTRGGDAVLRVKTPDVVLEPYLNFLIEVRWPQGRLLREYTVLLDLPGFATAPVAVPSAITSTLTGSDNIGSRVNRSNTSSAATLSRSAGQAVSSSATNASAANIQAGDGEIVVRANDTLWGIALEIKPVNASVKQTMMALQALNPNAFINNNINRLKEGAVLRVPDSAEMAGVDALAARQSVTDQPQSTRNKTAAINTSASNSTLDARAQTGRQQQEAPADGVLQLASVSGEQGSALGLSQVDTDTTQRGEQLSAEVARLRNALAVSLENLDRASVENSSMDSRLEAMESQLSDLEQLVSLKDQELQSMRAALAERRVALTEADAAAEAGVASAVVDEFAAGEVVVDEDLAAETVTNEATVAEVEMPQAAATPGLAATIVEKLSLSVEWLLGLGIAFIALLVGIFMWSIGRRQDDYEATVFEPVSDRDGERDAAAVFDTTADSDASAAVAVACVSAETADNTEESVVQLNADNVTAASISNVAAGDAPLNDTLVGLDATLSDTVFSEAEGDDTDYDPIAEADIYLAYGRHDQAEQMLEGAIKGDPGRSDLRLKLLEVYVDQGNAEAFKQACAALLAIDPDANIDAEALLRGEDAPSSWWPEGSVAAPADEFLEDYTEGEAETLDTVSDADLGLDLTLDLESDAVASAVDGSVDSVANIEADSATAAPGLQLAYDADSEQSVAGQDDVHDSQEDEVGTKLDLARAYIDMGDFDGAREILDEVLQEGSSEQCEQASSMMNRIA